MTLKAFALCLLLSLAASFPRAATAQTQMEMNIASDKQCRKASKAMNAAYQKLMSRLDAEGKKRLKKAQLSWIKFRDAETDLLSFPVEGGTIYPMVYADHKTEITQQRTKELNAAYTQFTTEGSMYGEQSGSSSFPKAFVFQTPASSA